MPRQANGNYLAPANTAAITATTISSTAYNTLETDIGTEITNSLDRLGRSAMQAALPMGGNKITGAADPTVSTDVATKNYVDTTTASYFSTGDIKPTIKTTADTGWVMLNNGTIGNAASNGSTRANVDCLALFTLIFNNLLDAWAPIFTSGGGATTRAAQTNAATAWAASCQIYLPQTLGRAWGFAGGGVGLTTRALGQTLGEETHLLTAAELPVITPTFAGVQRSWPSSQNNIPVNSGSFLTAAGGGSAQLFALGNISSKIDTLVTPDGTISSFGSGAVHNNIQPTVFINAMIKL